MLCCFFFLTFSKQLSLFLPRFNIGNYEFRHGIDLDNPGPSAPSASSLLQGSHCSPLEVSCNLNVAATYSDSGDSMGARSVDNATPPMHFLTPHVEISMADAPASFSPAPVCFIFVF